MSDRETPQAGAVVVNLTMASCVTAMLLMLITLFQLLQKLFVGSMCTAPAPHVRPLWFPRTWSLLHTGSLCIVRQADPLCHTLPPVDKEQQDTHTFKMVIGSDPAFLPQIETARLYKEAGVNPLAGCLPTLATIPVFIGLYRALSNAADDGLLTNGFFWIPSLGGPATLTDRAAVSLDCLCVRVVGHVWSHVLNPVARPAAPSRQAVTPLMFGPCRTVGSQVWTKSDCLASWPETCVLGSEQAMHMNAIIKLGIPGVQQSHLPSQVICHCTGAFRSTVFCCRL